MDLAKDEVPSEMRKYDMVLVDAMNQIYKSAWVFKDLKDEKGRDTGVIYGFFRFLLGLQKKYNGSLVVCWDGDKLEKREKNPDYKADRGGHKAHVYGQVDEVKRGVAMMGVRQCFNERYEADDIAATLVGHNRGKRILLVTDDKDWLQLQTEKVDILMKKRIMTAAEAEDETGLRGMEWVFYKSLCGKKNNVKGISRFPTETAAAVAKYMARKGLPAFTGDECDDLGIDARLARKVRENRETLNFAAYMVKLYDWVEIREIRGEKKLEDFVYFLGDYGIKSLIAEAKNCLS